MRKRNNAAIKRVQCTQLKMQRILDRLDIPLKVAWCPDSRNDKHGEIKSDFLFIYDSDPEEAWSTFQHEVYEFKFKQVTCPYYALVNSLIDGVQKLVYERKENFLAALPKISEAFAEERKSKNQSDC
jgi:hypothetical protein